MISYLKGKILYISSPLKKNSTVIIDVNGVGYRVIIPAKHLEKYKKDAITEFYTFHHIWDKGQELFGFTSRQEVDFFELLLQVPGIGPKTGLHILNEVEISNIQNAIIHNNPEILSRTGGMSQKTAEKLVLGLKDHLQKIVGSDISVSQKEKNTEIVEALMSLGFSREQALRAVSQIPQDLEKSEDKIKEALKILGRKK